MFLQAKSKLGVCEPHSCMMFWGCTALSVYLQRLRIVHQFHHDWPTAVCTFPRLHFIKAILLRPPWTSWQRACHNLDAVVRCKQNCKQLIFASWSYLSRKGLEAILLSVLFRRRPGPQTCPSLPLPSIQTPRKELLHFSEKAPLPHLQDGCQCLF